MLKATGGGSEREVLFRLKAVPDKGNTQTFKRLGEEATKAQTAIDRASENSEKKRRENHQRTNTAIGQSDERLRREAARGYDADLRESIRVGNVKTREAQKVANERIKAERAVTREAEQAAARQRSAIARNVEGTRQTIEGLTKLGRAFALSGVVGEENMQKVLDVLLKVQIAADGVRGSIDLIQGLSKTKIGGSILGGVGKAAGAAGITAGGLATAGAGAAAAVGVGAAGYSAWNLGKDVLHQFGVGKGSDPNSMYGKVGSFWGSTFTNMAGATGVAGLGSAGGNGRAKSWRPFSQAAQVEANLGRAQGRRRQMVGAMDAAEQAAQERIERERSERDRREAYQDEINSLRFADNPSRAAANRSEDARSELARAKRARKAVQLPDNPMQAARGTDSDRVGALQDELRAIERLTQAEKDRAQVEQQAAQNRMQTIRSTIDGYKAQADAHRNAIAGLEGEYTSQAKAFNAMSPMEQSQAADAKQRLDRGETLSERDAAMLERIGSSGDREKLDKQAIQRAEGSAGFDVFKKDFEKQASEHRAQIEALGDVVADLKQENMNLQKAASEATEGIIETVRKLRVDYEKLYADLQNQQAEMQANQTARETMRNNL